MSGDYVPRPGTRLLLRLYAIAIVTAVVIAGTWFAVHRLIHFPWRTGTALSVEALQEVPDVWASGRLADKVTRLDGLIGVSVYDPSGALVATNVHPPFSAPSADERLRAHREPTQRSAGVAVLELSRHGALLGHLVFAPPFPRPPLLGVMTDLVVISSCICLVGWLIWRTLVRPLQRWSGQRPRGTRHRRSRLTNSARLEWRAGSSSS